MSTLRFARHFSLGLGLALFALGASAADILTDKSGKTLYTFDADKTGSGTSACNDACAAVWPPVPASALSGKEYGEVTRKDGSKQLTYQGKPLYYYINDKKPGDVNGDNVNNVWHVVSAKSTFKESGSNGYSGYTY